MKHFILQCRRNGIRSPYWFIHLQFMTCLREMNRRPGLSLSPASSLIKAFYRHTHHRTGFTVHTGEMSDVWCKNPFTDAAKTSSYAFCRYSCGLGVDNICNASLLISLALSSTRWPACKTPTGAGEPTRLRSRRNPEDKKGERLHCKWLQMTMLMK